MANTVRLKRSAVPGRVPATTDLALGELAINTYDGKLYMLKDAGTPAVVEVTGGGTGSVSLSSITDWPVAVSATEVGYLDGVTSAIQTQLGNKQPLDADLTAIAGLAGTSGLLKKTAADTWSLDTSTYLTGNQSITLSGDATGSGATAITVTLANSGATAGTYKSVTVDAKGRVTGGTNPTTLAGYGITDALPLAGGTMTGAITFAGAQTWPTFNQDTNGSAGSVGNALTIGTGLSGTSYNGSAAVTIAVNYGTTGTTSCVGNDSRLSDARTPLSHSHGNITNAGAIGTTASLPIITTTSGVLTTGTFGTAAGSFCAGDDSRLSNTRNTTNSVTFNNGGAGAVSGSTFNGSAAVTISYNTVGAPSTTGTNASGSWGISVTGSSASCTGNAATATSATSFTSTTQNSQFNSVGVGTAASAVAGEIRATNNVTAYYSDRRLKNIFGEIPDALGKVERMSGIYFQNNEVAESFGYTDKSQQVGVIAQQVQAEVPEAVKRAPFDSSFTEDGEEYSVSGEEYLTVQYEKLVPVLLQAIKELSAKVKFLEGLAHA